MLLLDEKWIVAFAIWLPSFFLLFLLSSSFSLLRFIHTAIIWIRIHEWHEIFFWDCGLLWFLYTCSMYRMTWPNCGKQITTTTMKKGRQHDNSEKITVKMVKDWRDTDFIDKINYYEQLGKMDNWQKSVI